MKNINPHVLIVGAGPTGLMMACQLASHGVAFRIIEKNSGPTKETRAVGVQARTLEIFQQMGIAESAVEQGHPATAVNYINGNIRRHIPLQDMGKGLSAFSYMLLLEQSKTEKLLIDFLAKYKTQVEWDTELISLTQDTKSVTAVIKKKNKKEAIDFSYLLGADGAHSTLRHHLGIPLTGKTYKQSLCVLDCKVKAPFKEDEIYVSVSHDTFVGFFPLKGGKWRINSILPPEIGYKKDITFEDIQKHFSENIDIPVTLSHPNWLSVYHSHHRCIEKFREERCFLAGDAAHIHSPVGAQGMNAGLQDAYNLAWKLAYVLQQKAKPSLLDTYNGERLPFAKRLVATTDRVFSIVIAKNLIERFFTRYAAPFAMQYAIKTKTFRKFVFTTTSQIGISYRNSKTSTIASFGIFSTYAPHPGDRLPYIVYTNSDNEHINIQEYSNGKTFQILVFPGNQITPVPIEKSLQEYKGIFTTTIIPAHKNTQKLYKTFDIYHGGFYIIRPDMYIGYRSIGYNKKHFDKYLRQFLLPQ